MNYCLFSICANNSCSMTICWFVKNQFTFSLWIIPNENNERKRWKMYEEKIFIKKQSFEVDSCRPRDSSLIKYFFFESLTCLDLHSTQAKIN